MAYKFLDIVKSIDKHKIWEEMTSLITSYSKDKNEVVNLVAQSLLHLNNYSTKFHKPISRTDKDKSLKYIKLICRLKHLIYSETSRNGLNCLELSSDCFRIIIVLNDNRNLQNDCLFKQILFEYNKEKPTACPELLKSLSEGCYDQLLHHIYELQNLYAVGHDKPEQSKAFLCLQSLEEDINKLSKCPITTSNIGNEFNSMIPPPNNIIGLVKMRSGGIPAQFVFYCPPGSANDSDSNDRFKIVIQLMNHNEKKLLPFIPLVNLQKDINGNCMPSYATADALKCVPLAAKFVLRLSQPLVVSDVNINTILSVTELDVITTGFRANYLDLLLAQNNSSATYKDSFYCILPNDNQLVFQIADEELSIGAQIVTCIPFLLPNQLPKIISILKKQAVINTMLESFLMSDDSTQFVKDAENSCPISVSVIATDRFQFSLHRDNHSGKVVKFNLSYNEFSQVLVKFINTNKSEFEHQIKFQKIIQKFNNIPMGIFWLLYKSGDRFVMEPSSFQSENDFTENSLLELSNNKVCSNQFIEDSQFLDNCIAVAKSNLSINSAYQKDLFPRIKIEPKLELITTTTTCQSMLISPLTTAPLPHDGVSNKQKSGLMYTQEHPNPPIINQIDSNCSSLPISNATNGGSGAIMNSQVPLHKSEPQTVLYSSYGSKHMSLDQMLSSDFAMPFSSDSLGSLNSLSHSAVHYPDHPSSVHPSPGGGTGTNYPSYYNAPSHQKDNNTKLSRLYDPQSSVLVNLLNCNENPGSNNSTGFINRPMQRNISNPSPMSDQFDSPLMHSHLSRIPQTPRLRMPHPNASKPPSAASATAASPRPSLSSSISPSPPSKPDMMMMPYPQDTGNGRALMSRKPRKRKISTLELNQRLPKQPLMQPPTLRQSMPPQQHDVPHHSANQQQQQQHNIGSGGGGGGNNNNPIGMQHQPHSVSNSNFSSPTTMDQSIYDFDDNTDCGRSRGGINSSSGNSQSQQQSNNFNNIINRKLTNTPSKKPLKVKISRKAIVQPQNPETATAAAATNQDQPKPKEKLMKSNSIPIFNPSLSNVRSTAIMNAIDSPLTCSSLSSLQTSPHGSVSVSCSQLSAGSTIESVSDPTLMKKRRKRRLKSELEETPETIKKKEKLEIRKQNRKKKEMLLYNGNSQSAISSNSSLETVPGTDVNNIKAPLPIKLSLNPKTGSINNNTSSINPPSNRNTKNTNLPISASTQNPSIISSNSNSSSSGGGGSNNWMNQNHHSNTLSKQSLKQQSEQSKQQQTTGLIAEPLLKNYKIPKKKSSDSQISVAAFQDNLKPSNNNNKQNDFSKSSKESIDFLKSEPEQNTNSSGGSNPIEKPKTPIIMLHPDAAVSLSQQLPSNGTAIGGTVTEQDFKHYPSDMTTTATPVKQKNIHDIVDKLRAARSSNSATGTIVEPLISVNNSSAIASAISDFMPSKSTISSSSSNSSSCFNSDNQLPPMAAASSSENIFEKFSSSKNNGKSDHRQFTNSRFPDPSSMNMPRYSYNRPPAGFPAQKLRPGIGAPLPYGVPRQPFMGNPSIYRMDSGPMRNFSSGGNPPNIPYGPKKNSNNSFNNKKK